MRKKIILFVVPVLVCGLFSFTKAQTASELQAQLNALLAQLAALQAQLQAAGGGSSVPAQPGAYGACPSLYRTLRQGMSGSDVTQLQTFLASDRSIYPEGTVSGYFGALTESAVQRFQARHGIVSSGTPDSTGFGMVGPATRNAIARLCGGGATGPIVPVPGGACSFVGGQMPSGTVRTLYSVQIAPQGTTCAAYAQSRQCVNGVLSGSAAHVYASCSDSTLNCKVNNVELLNGQTRTYYSRESVNANQSCGDFAQARTCTNGQVSGNPDYYYLSCSVGTPGSCTLDGVTIPTGTSRIFYREKTVLFGQTCSPFGISRTCSNGSLSGDSDYRYASCSIASAGSCTVVASSTASTTVSHGASRTFYSVENVPYTESCSTYQQTRVCNDGVMTGSNAYKYPSCTVTPARTCAIDGITMQSGTSRTFYLSRTSSTNRVNEDGLSNVCSDISQTRTCTDGTLSGSAQYQYINCAPSNQEYCVLDGVYVAHGQSGTFYSQQTAPFGQSCSQYAQSRSCTDGVLAGSPAYQYASCTAAGAASCTLDGKTVAHNTSAPFYSVQTAPSGQNCDAYKQVRYCTDGLLSGSNSFKYQSCTNPTSYDAQQSNVAAALAAMEALLQAVLVQLSLWF